MQKNTGEKFEDKVYQTINNLVNSDKFLISNPNVKVHKHKKYFSKDRGDYIICDISVEKYIENLENSENLYPSIIVIIECKDYTNSISVDETEEFHAKLQQIGADNTKGIMITHSGAFQKSALKYAKSKGIALARILPDDQIQYILYQKPNDFSNLSQGKALLEIIKALTEKDFNSGEGEEFFSSTGESSLNELLGNLIK